MATDYRELKRLADDPGAARALADLLLTHRADLLSDSAQDLLASLKKRAGEKELTMRQLEALLDIRDRSTVSNKIGPYNLGRLVRQVWERRADLADYEDEEWIASLLERDLVRGLTEAERRRFVAICKSPGVDLIAADEWVDLRDRRS